MTLHSDRKSRNTQCKCTATRTPTRAIVRRTDSKILDSEEAKPRTSLDFNRENQALGMEILDVGKRVSEADLLEGDHFE